MSRKIDCTESTWLIETNSLDLNEYKENTLTSIREINKGIIDAYRELGRPVPTHLLNAIKNNQDFLTHGSRTLIDEYAKDEDVAHVQGTHQER